MAVDPRHESGHRVGRYVLFGEIAAGGMAHVHMGCLRGPAGFVKTVAIKRLARFLVSDPKSRAMFEEEARLAPRMQHRNVVSTFDVLEEDGELYLVMEYVHGESLSRLLARATELGERVPLRIAAAIASGMLHGLHAAHETTDDGGQPLGLVHRDVSPGNVMVGVDGVARIADFGIAKAAGRSFRTATGNAPGKVRYMAPEQLHGEAVDRRSDMYSAAIVIWEMLVGKTAFDGPNDGAVLMRVMSEELDAPSRAAASSGGGVDPALDYVVTRGLMKTADARFPTAEQMALAIETRTPLAPPSEVSAWVARLAADVLAKRAATMRDVERRAAAMDDARSATGSGAMTPVLLGATPVRAEADRTIENPTVARRLRVPMIVAGSAAAGALLVSMLQAKTGAPARAEATSVSAPVMPIDELRAPSTPQAVASAGELDPPSAAGQPAEAAEAATNTARAPKPLRGGGAATKPHGPSHGGSNASAAACTPPFRLDADGHKVFKKECL